MCNSLEFAKKFIDLYCYEDEWSDLLEAQSELIADFAYNLEEADEETTVYLLECSDILMRLCRDMRRRGY